MEKEDRQRISELLEGSPYLGVFNCLSDDVLISLLSSYLVDDTFEKVKDKLNISGIINFVIPEEKEREIFKIACKYKKAI